MSSHCASLSQVWRYRLLLRVRAIGEGLGSLTVAKGHLGSVGGINAVWTMS